MPFREFNLIGITMRLILILSLLVVWNLSGFTCDDMLLKRSQLLENAQDTKLEVPDKSYTDTVYVVKTKEFFKEVTSWKRAFAIVEDEKTGKQLLFMTSWRDPSKDSSHCFINKGIYQFFETTPGERDLYNRIIPDGLKEVQRGYLRAAEGGGFEVYDLSGAAMFERGLGGRESKVCSKAAQEVKDFFRKELKMNIGFAREEEQILGSPYGGSYGGYNSRYGSWR